MIYFAKWLLTKHTRAVIVVAGLLIAAAPLAFDAMIVPLPRALDLDLFPEVLTPAVCGRIDDFLLFCAASPRYRRIEQSVIAVGALIVVGGAYSAWRAKRGLRQDPATVQT